LSLGLTVNFNPVVLGGVKNLFVESKLGVAVAQLPKDAVFLPTTTEMGNILVAMGRRSLSGTHLYPQFELWRHIDPKGKFYKAYNRYGHIQFRHSEGKDTHVSNPNPDSILVETSFVQKPFMDLPFSYLVWNSSQPPPQELWTKYSIVKEIDSNPKAYVLSRRQDTDL
jgi:hypothetical protein